MADKKEVCQSKECAERAKFILASIDNSKDPCDDFYSFACGGFMKQDFVKNRAQHHFIAVWLKAIAECEDLMTELPIKDEAVTATEKAALLYQECKKNAFDEEKVLWAVKKIFSEKGLDLWPILPDDATSAKRIASLEELLLRTGMRSFCDLSVMERSDGTHLILLQPSPQPLIKLQQVSKNAAQQVLNVSAKMIMPQLTHDQFEKYAKSVLAFNEGYQKNGGADQSMRNLAWTPFRTTVDKLERLLPDFPLRKLLNNEFLKANITLRRHQGIVVSSFEQFRSLVNYYKKNLEGAYNAFGAEEAHEQLLMFSNAYHKALEHILGVDYAGALSSEPMNCYLLLRTVMPEVVSRLYALNKLSSDTKNQAWHILNVIGNAYYSHLRNVPWMDRATREATMEKLWRMVPVVGYPDVFLNESFVDRIYDKVGTLRRNLSVPIIIHRLQELAHVRGLSLLDTKEKDIFVAHSNDFHLEDVGASYFKMNAILVSAALLQHPFFHSGLPTSVNLGAVGTLMAREITHAYELPGTFTDAYGRQHDLATHESMDLFQESVDCLKEQYSNILDPLANMTLRGVYTVNENIADNGGVRIAFNAHVMLSDGQPEVALPGLENFTPDQLFFLSYGTMWCHAESADINADIIKHASHSLSRYRVNVPLKNMEQFAAAFQCKSRSRMRLHEKERCVVI